MAKILSYREYVESVRHIVETHRAAGVKITENSRAGILLSFLEGKVTEIDIRPTADKVFILLHDPDFGRTGRIAKNANEMTWDEVSRIQLRNREGGDDEPLTDQTPITFEDALKMLKGRQHYYHLDLKVQNREYYRRILEMAETAGVLDQVYIWKGVQTQQEFEWIKENYEMMNQCFFLPAIHLQQPNAEEQIGFIKDLGLNWGLTACELMFNDLEQAKKAMPILRDAGIKNFYTHTLTQGGAEGTPFMDPQALEDPDSVWGPLLDLGFKSIQTDRWTELQKYIDGRSSNKKL